MDIEGFRKAGYAAVDKICDYYYSLQNLPVTAQVKPGFLEDAISPDAPEEPEPWDVIHDDFHTKIMPGITHWQHPNFYGFFPCNTTFEGALADLYCAAISNPGFNWSCSPSVTELEILMVDWISKMLGLSEAFLSTSASGTGGGIILGSASEVTLTVAIGARERALRLVMGDEAYHGTPAAANGVLSRSGTASPDRAANGHGPKSRGDLTSKLVMYGTTQTHTVGSKAALILGLDFRALEVSADDGFGLRGETLRAAIEEDEAAGRIPFLLVATVGTTSSGAVDNLTEIAEITKAHPTLWLHVDAAYAGVALSLPELRESCHLDAINAHVDSFSTNLHKWGLVQFDCSPLFIKDRNVVSEALTITPAYLRTAASTHRLVQEMRNLQIPLGRRFRSLKVWFVLRSYGISGFRSHLRNSITLSQTFERSLHSDSSGLFEIVAPPRWAMVVFRLNPTKLGGTTDVDLEELNKVYWQRLQAYLADFVLTQTMLPGVGFCVRFVVGSPQTREEHVNATWSKIQQCGHQVWKEYAAQELSKAT
ncbi:hypothetical protein ACQY0O_001910 [Thecaphora frezii]